MHAIHTLLDRIFKLLYIKEAPYEADRMETRKQLITFITFVSALGGAGAFVALVAWYTAQL